MSENTKDVEMKEVQPAAAPSKEEEKKDNEPVDTFFGKYSCKVNEHRF